MNYLLNCFVLTFIAFTFAETCNVNEEFKECGTACPTTCSNMDQTDRVCTLQCVQGCFCQEPYVRDVTTGKCVLREQCLQRQVCSDPNEVYKSCGTDCPLTCKNFANPPKLCDRVCRVGCFCSDPYVRDETTGKCVVTKDCPHFVN